MKNDQGSNAEIDQHFRTLEVSLANRSKDRK